METNLDDCMWQNRPILDEYSFEDLMNDMETISDIELIFPTDNRVKFSYMKSVIYKFTIEKNGRKYPMMIKFILRNIPDENNLEQDFEIQKTIYSVNADVPLCPKPYFYSLVAEDNKRDVLSNKFFNINMNLYGINSSGNSIFSRYLVGRKADILDNGILVTQFLEGFTTIEDGAEREIRKKGRREGRGGWYELILNLARLQLVRLFFLGYMHNDAHIGNFMMDRRCLDRILETVKKEQDKMRDYKYLPRVTLSSAKTMLVKKDSQRGGSPSPFDLFMDLPEREEFQLSDYEEVPEEKGEKGEKGVKPDEGVAKVKADEGVAEAKVDERVAEAKVDAGVAEAKADEGVVEVKVDEEEIGEVHKLICADSLNALILIDFGFCKGLSSTDVSFKNDMINNALRVQSEGGDKLFIPQHITQLLTIIKNSHAVSWRIRNNDETIDIRSDRVYQANFGWIDNLRVKSSAAQFLCSCLSYSFPELLDAIDRLKSTAPPITTPRISFGGVESEGEEEEEEGIGKGMLDLSKIMGSKEGRGGRRIKRKKKTKKTKKRRPRRTRKRGSGKRKNLKASRRGKSKRRKSKRS